MRKYKCSECHEDTPCVLEWFDYPPPSKCPAPGDGHAIWREVIDPPKQLPKLTAEVFDRPDCPEWARWAGLNSRGQLIYWPTQPELKNGGRTWSWSGWDCMFADDFFDATDWQNSLIERPAKLPEWCKVGAWVWVIEFRRCNK